MKILTKEEQDAHYQATVKGGVVGGVVGLALSSGAIWWASRRFPAVRNLTLPFRVFVPASVGTFTSIIAADRASNAYEIERNQQRFALAHHVSEYDKYERQKPFLERAKDWAANNRYPIVVGSWAASMIIALAIVRRNPYLSNSQKIVQARVYAQGLTIGVLLASFALEANDATKGKGRWETVKVLDPTDPLHQRLIEKRIHHERYEGEDQWMEVIETEERKMKERQAEHEAERKVIEEANRRASKHS